MRGVPNFTSDIVIVSYNLLQNKNYVAFPNDPKTFAVGKQRKHNLEAIGIEDEPSVAVLTTYKRFTLMPQTLEKVKDKAPKSLKGVILDHFHWHRIVMDEGHELIVDKTVNGKKPEYKKKLNCKIATLPCFEKFAFKLLRVSNAFRRFHARQI